MLVRGSSAIAYGWGAIAATEAVLGSYLCIRGSSGVHGVKWLSAVRKGLWSIGLLILVYFVSAVLFAADGVCCCRIRLSAAVCSCLGLLYAAAEEF